MRIPGASRVRDESRLDDTVDAGHFPVCAPAGVPLVDDGASCAAFADDTADGGFVSALALALGDGAPASPTATPVASLVRREGVHGQDGGAIPSSSTKRAMPEEAALPLLAAVLGFLGVEQGVPDDARASWPAIAWSDTAGTLPMPGGESLEDSGATTDAKPAPAADSSLLAGPSSALRAAPEATDGELLGESGNATPGPGIHLTAARPTPASARRESEPRSDVGPDLAGAAGLLEACADLSDLLLATPDEIVDVHDPTPAPILAARAKAAPASALSLPEPGDLENMRPTTGRAVSRSVAINDTTDPSLLVDAGPVEDGWTTGRALFGGAEQGGGVVSGASIERPPLRPDTSVSGEASSWTEPGTPPRILDVERATAFRLVRNAAGPEFQPEEPQASATFRAQMPQADYVRARFGDADPRNAPGPSGTGAVVDRWAADAWTEGEAPAIDADLPTPTFASLRSGADGTSQGQHEMPGRPAFRPMHAELTAFSHATAVATQAGGFAATLGDVPSVARSVSDAAPAEPTADSQPLDHAIVQSLRILWRQGAGEVRLRLKPEYLGELTVSLRLQGSAVTAVLQSESPALRSWIESHQADLRRALEEQGLSLHSLVVDPDGHAQQQPHGQTRDDRRPYRWHRNAELGRFEALL